MQWTELTPNIVNTTDDHYLVSANMIVYIYHGLFHQITLSPDIDIRTQICESLGISHHQRNSFHYLLRTYDEHILVLPNNSLNTDGITCQNIAPKNLICLQWAEAPIQYHRRFNRSLSDHLVRRINSSDNSFYYALGFGIIQMLLIKGCLIHLKTLCLGISNSMSHRLNSLDRINFRQIGPWIDLHCNNSRSTDFIDYSLEFLVPFGDVFMFSLPRFSLILGQLLVIEQLSATTIDRLEKLGNLHAEYAWIKDIDELSEQILYPTGAILPFQAEFLSSSFLQDHEISLSIQEDHEVDSSTNESTPSEDFELVQNDLCVQLLLIDNRFSIINKLHEFKYAGLSSDLSESAVRLILANERKPYPKLTFEIVLVDCFIRYLRLNFRIVNATTSGNLVIMGWPEDLASLPSFIIPQNLHGYTYIIEFHPVEAIITLYSTVRVEWRDESHSIINHYIQAQTSSNWTINDVIIPEYNNCIALSLCYLVADRFTNADDPMTMCQEFIDAFTRDSQPTSHHHLHIIPPITTHHPQVKVTDIPWEMTRSDTDLPLLAYPD